MDAFYEVGLHGVKKDVPIEFFYIPFYAIL